MTTTTTTTSASTSTQQTDMKNRLWDANRLVKIILGRDHDTRLQSGDFLEAIRAFADMKSELELHRKNSALTKRLSLSAASSRHAAHQHLASPQAVLLLAAAVEEQEQWIEPVSATAAATLVAPTKSLSLGVGTITTIGELKISIVSWTKRFEELNETHEQHLQECQAQIKQVLGRAQALDVLVHLQEAIYDKQQQAAEARQHVDKLVEIVAAFPNKARLQELEQQLLTVQEQEQKVQQQNNARLKRELRGQQDFRQQEDLTPRRLFVENSNTISGSTTNNVSKEEKRERSKKQVRKLVWQNLKSKVSKIRVSISSRPSNKGDSSKELDLDRTFALTPERECKTTIVVAAARSEDHLRAGIPSQVEFQRIFHPTIHKRTRAALLDDLNFDSEEEEFLLFNSSDRSSEHGVACSNPGDAIDSQLSVGGDQSDCSISDILEKLAQALESPVSDSTSDYEAASMEHESYASSDLAS